MPLPLSPPSASVHSRFPLPLDRETDSPSCFGIHCATQSQKMSLHKCQNQYVTHTRMKDPTKQIAWEQTRIMTQKYIHCELSGKQVLILDGIMSLWPTAELGSSHGSLSHCQEKKTWQGGWWSLSNNSVLFMMSFTIPIIRKKIMIPKRNTKPRKTTPFLAENVILYKKILPNGWCSVRVKPEMRGHTYCVIDRNRIHKSFSKRKQHRKNNKLCPQTRQNLRSPAEDCWKNSNVLPGSTNLWRSKYPIQFESAASSSSSSSSERQKNHNLEMGDKKAGNPKNEHGVKCRENWPPKRP